jgi:hypothetical protein
MRGRGAVVVGDPLTQVVARRVYMEVNARLQAQAVGLGGEVRHLDPDEARRAEAVIDRTLGRPWELWKRKALGKERGRAARSGSRTTGGATVPVDAARRDPKPACRSAGRRPALARLPGAC